MGLLWLSETRRVYLVVSLSVHVDNVNKITAKLMSYSDTTCRQKDQQI